MNDDPDRVVMSREEIERLKWNWRNDPIYDLLDVPGTEPYRAELQAWIDQCQADWLAREKEEHTAEYHFDQALYYLNQGGTGGTITTHTRTECAMLGQAHATLALVATLQDQFRTAGMIGEI